jgi:hypothetical protein
MSDQNSRDSAAGLPRPFVPTGTPTGPNAPPASGLARPFVPGGIPRTESAASPSVPVQKETTPTGEYSSDYYWPRTEASEQDDSELAEQAWSDLDWDADTRARSLSRAEHVALALEQVARRIREGELIVRGHPGMTHEAAAAAVLAALVAQRR